MSVEVKSFSEFYEIHKNEVQATAPEFTDFSEGSIQDILAGAIATGCNELSELIVSEFSKTFFELAENGDIDRLAVDHFGDSFKRPEASKSSLSVVFTRANISAGNVLIPAGTVVKTVKNASGKEVRFLTDSDETMTGLTVSVNVTAVDSGTDGNVAIGKITVIESALTDASITVNNSVAGAGGKETLNDAEYKEFIKAKILALAGATEAAIKGAALSVTGVSMVQAVTKERVVIDYDIANSQILAGSTFFRIPYPILYVADANGNSSESLVEAVRAAVFQVKAAGVKIQVEGALAISIDWLASLTLNASGPNYAEFQYDLTKITDSMKEYMNEKLTIGAGFNKSLANAYIMAIWGPSGTGDLSSFSTLTPAGNVSVSSNEKLIAGNIGIQ